MKTTSPPDDARLGPLSRILADAPGSKPLPPDNTSARDRLGCADKPFYGTAVEWHAMHLAAWQPTDPHTQRMYIMTEFQIGQLMCEVQALHIDELAVFAHELNAYRDFERSTEVITARIFTLDNEPALDAMQEVFYRRHLQACHEQDRERLEQHVVAALLGIDLGRLAG